MKIGVPSELLGIFHLSFLILHSGHITLALSEIRASWNATVRTSDYLRAQLSSTNMSHTVWLRRQARLSSTLAV